MLQRDCREYSASLCGCGRRCFSQLASGNEALRSSWPLAASLVVFISHRREALRSRKPQSRKPEPRSPKRSAPSFQKSSARPTPGQRPKGFGSDGPGLVMIKSRWGMKRFFHLKRFLNRCEPPKRSAPPLSDFRKPKHFPKICRLKLKRFSAARLPDEQRPLWTGTPEPKRFPRRRQINRSAGLKSFWPGR